MVQTVAQAVGARVALRIDDIDSVRTRPEYVDDVFDALHWLGIDWSVGPRSARNFWQEWQQADRMDEFTAALDQARADGMPLYVCQCSRRDFASHVGGSCPQECRARDLDFVAQETAIRVHVPESTTIDVEGRAIRLDEVMGDFVVWRRDGIPAYQFASLVMDLRLGADLIIRGDDLTDSTAAQLYLSRWMPGEGLRTSRIIHHALVRDRAGRKLAKSSGDGSQPMARTQAQHQTVTASAAALSRDILRTGHL